MERPDFIDVEQVIERLEIDRATFRRWQHQGAAPEPDRYFDGQPLWWWDKVEHWSRQRGRTRRRPFQKRLPDPDLVNLDGIARRLRVTKKVAHRWRQQSYLVEPDYRWSFGEAWLWETVRAWSRAGQRRPVAVPVEPVQTLAAPVDETDTEAPALEGFEELEALVARLDELEASLDGVIAQTEAVGRSIEHDAVQERMDRVVAFIEHVDS